VHITADRGAPGGGVCAAHHRGGNMANALPHWAAVEAAPAAELRKAARWTPAATGRAGRGTEAGCVGGSLNAATPPGLRNLAAALATGALREHEARNATLRRLA